MLLSLPEAARRLGKSERQVRYLIRNGQVPAQKTGGRWMVDSESLPLPARATPLGLRARVPRFDGQEKRQSTPPSPNRLPREGGGPVLSSSRACSADYRHNFQHKEAACAAASFVSVALGLGPRLRGGDGWARVASTVAVRRHECHLSPLVDTKRRREQDKKRVKRAKSQTRGGRHGHNGNRGT
jgi:hypothetical protein